MKQSNYNYIIERGEKTYWFNGMSRDFFILENSLSKKVEDILASNINYLKKNSPTFYERLVHSQFLQKNQTDEINLIKDRYSKAVNKKNYLLVILPTLNCNFSCWYCIQDHIKTKMNSENIEKVKQHLKRTIQEDKIESLEIQWFGGEPFMYFSDVIAPISRYAMKLCKDANIPFLNSATTNGHYLSPNILNDLMKLNFNFFQITIDGVRDKHNKVKHTVDKNYSAFDEVLNNINHLLSNSSEIKINLRINYTRKNLDKLLINQLNEKIQAQNRSRIVLSFKKVWQEKTDNQRAVTIKEIATDFINSGYKIDFDVNTGGISCYTDKKWYNAINYNGNIVKCTANNDLYSKTPPGKLQRDGSIKWRENYIENYFNPRFDNTTCLECKHLPICMGNCNENYDEKTTKKFECNQILDIDYENRIINYIDYENKY